MPKIDVFLMFDPSDRNFEIKNKKKTVEKGPNWEAIKVELTRRSYDLTVYGPPYHPTVQDVQDSMSSAEVTLLVGHGGVTPGTPVGAKWITDQIMLNDGFIRSPDGVFSGKWNGSTLDGAKNSGKLRINRVTGIFTCNSSDKMPGAFDLPPDSHLITNDGGPDGFTRIGTLEQGASEFVLEYVRKRGDVAKAMTKAQVRFRTNGRAYAGDKDDTLSDKVGAAAAPAVP